MSNRKIYKITSPASFHTILGLRKKKLPKKKINWFIY